MRLRNWAQHDLVRELSIRTPSLEEIFVAYLESAQRGDAAPAASEVVVP